jgi:hypothetical protein
MRVGNSRSRPDQCHPEARARAFQGSGVRRREQSGAPLGAARKLTLSRHLFSSSRGNPEKPPKERTSDARDRAFVRIAIRRATCASMRVEIAAFVASSARVGVRRRRQSRSRKSERARARAVHEFYTRRAPTAAAAISQIVTVSPYDRDGSKPPRRPRRAKRRVANPRDGRFRKSARDLTQRSRSLNRAFQTDNFGAEAEISKWQPRLPAHSVTRN